MSYDPERGHAIMYALAGLAPQFGGEAHANDLAHPFHGAQGDKVTLVLTMDLATLSALARYLTRPGVDWRNQKEWEVVT